MIKLKDFKAFAENSAKENSNGKFDSFLEKLSRGKVRLIILIDIVGFSKSSTEEQLATIYSFQKNLRSRIFKNQLSSSNRLLITDFIPTGDGCYIIANECRPEAAIDFLIGLVGNAGKQTKTPMKPLRVSALIGECVAFIDLANHKNFVGVGMNEASRILSGGQKVLEEQFKAKHPDAAEDEVKHFSRNSIFLGDSLACVAEKYADKCAEIVHFKDVSDKHGITRNITVLRSVENEVKNIPADSQMLLQE